MKRKLFLLNLIAVIALVSQLVLNYFFPESVGSGFVTASVIGALVSGAGIQTTFSGQSWLDGYMLIGDIDTAMPLSGISVEVDGKAVINIAGSQQLVSAFSKYMQQFSATVVGLTLKLATGRVFKNTTYRLTNNGATTPNIMVYSDNDKGVPVRAVSVGINATSFMDFNNFSALQITPSANVNNLEFTFSDGSKSTMLAIEADALFALSNATEANGRLDAVVTTIDNFKNRNISNVRVNTTTAVTVLVINIG